MKRIDVIATPEAALDYLMPERRKHTVTNYSAWVCHYHFGTKKKPLTVYLMDDGTYEVRFDGRIVKGLSENAAAALVGHIVMQGGPISL